MNLLLKWLIITRNGYCGVNYVICVGKQALRMSRNEKGVPLKEGDPLYRLEKTIEAEIKKGATSITKKQIGGNKKN